MEAEDAVTSISVFDMCGFECHGDSNDFGTLCRNYANDYIQELFVNMFFEDELDDCEREGVVLPFEYKPSNGCINLLERSQGLIQLLHQETASQNENLKTLLKHLHHQFSHDPNYEQPADNHGFMIKHCAGPVHYTVKHLLEMNRGDKHIRKQLASCLSNSSSSLVREIFPSDRGRNETHTMLYLLRTALGAMMRNVKNTNPYFVICMNPNRHVEKVGAPNLEDVSDQIRAMQIVDMLHVRKEGYSVNITFDIFYKRYSILSPGKQEDDPMFKAQCERILLTMNFEGEMVPAVGRTKVFMSRAQLEQLDNARLGLREEAVKKLQGFYKSNRFYRRLMLAREASLALVPFLQGVCAREQYKRMRETAQMKEEEAQTKFLEETVFKGMSKEDQERTMMHKEENLEMQNKWRDDDNDKALNDATEAFRSADEMIKRADALYNAAQAEVDESGMHHISIDRILEDIKIFQHERYDAVVEETIKCQRDLRNEEAGRKRLEIEENYLRKVRTALAMRYVPHPLEELAVMRAEDTMQQVYASLANL